VSGISSRRSAMALMTMAFIPPSVHLTYDDESEGPAILARTFVPLLQM